MSESNEKAAGKSLGHDDQSGFQFAREMLCGDVTAAVNFTWTGRIRGGGMYPEPGIHFGQEAFSGEKF